MATERAMNEIGEAELLAACSEGRLLDCAESGGRRTIEAITLRRCCHQLKGQVDPYGIRLRNALVTGHLDLAGLDVPFPLRFEGCDFEAAPLLEGAQLYDLAFVGCLRLPGLLANGLRIRRDLDLSGSHVTGSHRTSASGTKQSAIWLFEADIEGLLLCAGTAIRADGERSIQADRMHAGSARFIRGFTAIGEIRLRGALIDGSLDLTGAHVETSTGPAIDLGDAQIGGSMFLIEDLAQRCPILHGRLDMGNARISGQLLIRNATLKGSPRQRADGGYAKSREGGTAVSAPRLSVGAEVTLEGSCEAMGGVDLSMSDISSLAIDGDCTIRAAGQVALDLTNAGLRSNVTIYAGATVQGAIRLTGAHVRGNLTLEGADLAAPQGPALIAAQGVRVDGETDLRNLKATGGHLEFAGAALGSFFDATGAHIRNPAGRTLSLHHAEVKGSVRLGGGFESTGLLLLNRSVIDGRLDLTGGVFDCPDPASPGQRGHAIEAVSATIRAGMELGWAVVSPSVDFTNARTTFLADDPGRWPPRFIVSGFTYDRFERPLKGGRQLEIWDRAARCAWLRRQVAYDSGPYEHAARVYRQHGYTSEAEEILMDQRAQARRAGAGHLTILRRMLDAIYGVTVGYGYRPSRVLWLLAALLLLVIASLDIPPDQATLRATTVTGIVYTTHGPLQTGTSSTVSQALPSGNSANSHLLQSGSKPSPDGPPLVAVRTDSCGSGRIRCFNSAFYAIDTVVPLVSLDQRSTWYPDPNTSYGSFMQWWLNLATLLGWLLSSIFVLSLARLARTA